MNSNSSKFRESSYLSEFRIVSIHHSSHHDAPIIGWLFLKNSPNATSISPRNSISSRFFLYFFASFTVFNCNTSPFFSFIIGPSIESTGTTQLPFPGYSIFNWVPTAKNSISSIVAGLTPIVASPVFLDLPYLNLNAPFSDGYPSIGLPPIIS